MEAEGKVFRYVKHLQRYIEHTHTHTDDTHPITNINRSRKTLKLHRAKLVHSVLMEECEFIFCSSDMPSPCPSPSLNNDRFNHRYLEKYIAHARHIEVQIFGDGDGNAVHVGERECSIQRRHQKVPSFNSAITIAHSDNWFNMIQVIEESPSPNLSSSSRSSMCEAALRLARHCSYRSAGTVEFLYDQDTQSFYFLGTKISAISIPIPVSIPIPIPIPIPISFRCQYKQNVIHVFKSSMV